MESDLAQERQQAHALLDRLPAEKLNAVRVLLEAMVEPLGRSLASVPVEGEEITSDTAAALERARASLASGKNIPHSEIRLQHGGVVTERRISHSRFPDILTARRSVERVAVESLESGQSFSPSTSS